ncbi:hypothetical protein MHB48_16715 [Psychrobacillus sp. FSL H8-0483]|uniref:hypothetical protein n=1 Tax=Psychrobacillus sp. FSL H8-0483 TaxID=2921389 RepID=UPI003159D799
MSEYFIIYIEIERKIDFYYQMQHIETQFELRMTMDEIISERNQFKLQHVYDISHKPFSFGGGILYLHTNQGVFSYKIQDNPATFIHAFKSLKTEN